MADPVEAIAGLEDVLEEEEVDEVVDRKKMRANLFGDSDSEEEAEPGGKSALAKLATRKRLERQEAEQQEQAERSRKRPREAPDVPEEPARADAGGDASEDEGPEEPANAEDAAFIDDAGQALDDQPQQESESEEEPDRAAGPAPDDEAEEEEDEFQKMFASKGRKRQGARTAGLRSKSDVDSFMGMMEAAALTDLDANREGKPAVHKLKMLAEAEDMLARRDLHNTFLDGGLLGVLKAWLEPMPDGSLPNERVRSAVLCVLQQLPIDVTDEGRKDQLKRSGIGKVVLFLFKLPDESPANRRAAKELVEKWSRLIFDQYRERRDGDAHERELQLLQARRQHEHGADGGGAGEQESEKRALRPGDLGFRWHASIPEPARLDYVRRPTSQVAADVNKGRRTGGKMDKRLKMMNRPGRTALAKAAKVSVEGRGM